MIKQIIFKNIKFSNITHNHFRKIISQYGYFVFPAAPALAQINSQKNYYKALKKADLAFFDSGFFVILLKIFKGINVNKFSGYKFLNLFFDYLKTNKNKSVLCIDPNKENSKANYNYFKKIGVKKIHNYVAPKYNPKNIKDKKLLKIVKKTKPNFILTNIGGGSQEILGQYLKENIKRKTTILCTGAAIGFYTGKQAPINSLIDKIYLGWLIRLIFNPILFLKRYIHTFKLINLVIRDKISIK